ncbi:MAG: glycosyltransferase [Desulfobacterales bacterium]|nr:glycosyltransferase [Desulfobacterales bacterium]
MITVVIPYREGEPIGRPPEGDETLWMNSDLGIGEGRIKGAQQASYDRMVFVDADGVYPDDFIDKVEDAINSGEYPDGFWCVRKGGFVRTYLESGLVVHRDLFLERVKHFLPNHRRDIGELFEDLPTNDEITYRHGLTKRERGVLAAIFFFLLL